MINNRKEKATEIIRNTATAAAVTSAALAQGAIIGADIPALTALHIDMIRSLAELFNLGLNDEDLLARLGTLSGVSMGATSAKALLGWFPGVGNLANATITFTHTEALGWAAYKYFEESIKSESS